MVLFYISALIEAPDRHHFRQCFKQIQVLNADPTVFDYTLSRRDVLFPLQSFQKDNLLMKDIGSSIFLTSAN